MRFDTFMRSCLWMFLAGALVLPLCAEDASTPATVDVVASGVGKDETEATKDALANAVRQAIGAIVGLDTMVQNEEVVRDQILTYSDGFVEKYEVVGKPSSTPSGLTSITIRARIVRDRIIQKARAANISLLEVDGKSMFAEAVTKIERRKSALALITAEFEGMPAKLITAEIVGKPVYDEKAQQATIAARLAVDEAAYGAFVGRLTKILDGIGGPSFTASSVRTETRRNPDTGADSLSDIFFPKSEFPEKYLYNIQGWQDTNYAVVAVCSTHNASMTSSQWRMYVVEPAVLDAINAKLNCLSIAVEVLDENDRVLDCRYIPLGKLDPYNSHRHFEGPITFETSGGDLCNSEQLLIAPFADGRLDAQTWFNSVKFEVRGGLTATPTLQFELKPEDLAKVAKVRCKVTSAGTSTGE